MLTDCVSARWSPMYQYLALTMLRDSHHSGLEPAILDWYGQCVDGLAMQAPMLPQKNF